MAMAVDNTTSAAMTAMRYCRVWAIRALMSDLGVMLVTFQSAIRGRAETTR
ncbi:hypothetical protein D3C75_1238020 [compost metagenome]